MLEPWNDAALQPPPVHTFSSNHKFGIQDLKTTCKNIIKVLSNQSPLHKESAVLSRFGYKFDKKFRNDIGYRHYKKVNVALRRYLGLNILKAIENFCDTLPADNDEVYLPTRQMLQYVLVRLITFSKIILRVCVCSKQASVFYLDRIKCGESHWMSLMPYAVLSRVWSLCSVLLRRACGWYSRLYPWLAKLELKGVDFLPNNYNLPLDLEEWLDLKNIDNFGRFEWATDKRLTLHQSLIADEDDDHPDSLLDYVNQINEGENVDELLIPYNKIDNLAEVEPAPKDINKILSTDKGEIISRDSFKAAPHVLKPAPVCIPETKQIEFKKDNKDSHSPACVIDSESLLEFMTNEEGYRNEQNSLSLTSHLSFMQWQALKNSLVMLANSLSNKRKIEKKFKKVWKEKCLDYM